jgi:hypothetical protein
MLDMAQIYLADKNWDAATAMLERLKNSPDPEVAKSANEQLAGLPTLRKYGVLPQDQTPAQSQPAASTASQPAGPSVRAPSSTKRSAEPGMQSAKQNPKTDDEEVNEDHSEPIPAAPQIDKRAIKFVKGKLLAIDCTQPPAAVLTVSAGTRVLKLRTPDYKSLTLIGADQFSCEWKGRAVAVNYRAGGATDGDLVSLEVQ